MGKVFHSTQRVSFKEKAMPSGDVYIITPPEGSVVDLGGFSMGFHLAVGAQRSDSAPAL
jgi:hypothetical protein